MNAVDGYAYDGAFASPPLAQNLETRAPFASVLTGRGAAISNTPGTVSGRFGWLNPATGVVNNTRVSPADKLGVVVPYRSVSGAGVLGGARFEGGAQAAWTWQFYDPTVTPSGGVRIRPGLGVNLMSRGNFWLRFYAGAIYGNQVYANSTDGSALSGASSGGEATPFYVCSEAQPGRLAIVSNTAKFSP